MSQLKEGDMIFTDSLKIADLFNTFFVTEPLKLLNWLSVDLEYSLERIKNWRAEKSKPLFRIPHITPQNIKSLLKSMPAHKATGVDGLGAKILKAAAPAIALPLSRLINHCIENSTFPSAWKLGKITPIYKGKGSKDEMNNYRPISVLPLLSKIFEKHIHKVLYSYLKENNLLYHLQSGFRRSHSTETALIRLTDQLLLDLDKDNVSGLVFIDYKKAFDLIDHEILLSKLEAYGVESKELNLFAKYLQGRKQFVVIDGAQSETKLITHGVPHGSVLGPLLFLIFINDLPISVTKSVVDIFADDTTLSASAKTPPVVQQQLQDDTNKVVEWSTENRMVISAPKTKTLLVTGKRLESRFPNAEIKIIINDKNVEQVSSQKLLGVTLDKHLNFNEHIDNMCSKLSQRIGVLNKIKRNLAISERKLYYNAMIKPIILYGSCVWSSTSSENLDRVYKLQKRAARVILDAGREERSACLFQRLNWLPLREEIKMQKCCLVFKRITGDTPSYMEKMFVRNSDLHNRASRHGNYNLVCPRYNRETEGGRSFQINCTKLWNSIPVEIRKKDTFNSFKIALRNYLQKV